jgi:hypothetical protein
MRGGGAETLCGNLAGGINPWERAKFYVKLNAHHLIQIGVDLSGATNAWYKYDYGGGAVTDQVSILPNALHEEVIQRLLPAFNAEIEPAVCSLPNPTTPAGFCNATSNR